MKTITFIGNGAMAQSIAQSLKASYLIEVAGRDLAKLQAFEAKLGVGVSKHSLDNFDITNKIVLLCIKPHALQSVAQKLYGNASLLLSVLAGTTIAQLSAHIHATHIIRTMPNLAASIGKSMTTLTGDSDDHSKQFALQLMGGVGRTLWLESEKELDIATALAGSGPAYLALIAEALSDGAVKQGLKREYAMEVTRGLFEGFGTLIETIHPALLKDSVMSPGGTTAAGYTALERGGTRVACIDAIEAAYLKAISLSQINSL